MKLPKEDTGGLLYNYLIESVLLKVIFQRYKGQKRVYFLYFLVNFVSMTITNIYFWV